ncbi:chorismate synthase [Parachlamydia acanthamoebae]|uniref:chorismate synthase n=1 Tax=Parachlamydia acanthamoebae TaxID=83552 RepID=UPI0024E25A70|nr:chorismate synthase [Parachlamydia acanthamoebae]
MASNTFGNIFRMTTWGESHGKAIGVVVDGCPAGLDIHESDIQTALALRAPGRNLYTSPRVENDKAQILSGIFEGKTTGAPISILISNHDADSSKYECIKDLLRPGHANYTYLEKYGIFDYRGGGRASARETACRVAAGAIAKKLLQIQGIQIIAYIKQIGLIQANVDVRQIEEMRNLMEQNPLFCPDLNSVPAMIDLIEKAINEKDSLGGVVEFAALSIPVGLGDPIYQKLEAHLAYAMMSIPASKGFEIGEGFQSVSMPGSVHNDRFENISGKIQTETNHAGGILGGISNGMPIVGKVAFKPTSSIMQPQKTVTMQGEMAAFQLPEGSRHDPCVAIRAVPVVEAMLAIVLADAMLLNRCVKL